LLLSGGFSSSASEAINKPSDITVTEAQDNPKKNQEDDEALNRRVVIMNFIGLSLLVVVGFVLWRFYGNGNEQEEASPSANSQE
jgi:hypothetical protein